MGWTGIEGKISLGMIFKKMYCHKCGKRLSKIKKSVLINKGHPKYDNTILGHHTVGMDSKKCYFYVYKCFDCNYEIDHYEQLKINKIQKKLKKRILEKNELNY